MEVFLRTLIRSRTFGPEVYTEEKMFLNINLARTHATKKVSVDGMSMQES